MIQNEPGDRERLRKKTEYKQGKLSEYLSSIE